MPTRYTSRIKNPGPLAEPLTFAFSGRTARNRFMKAALTERLSSWHPTADKETRGIPSKELIRVYQRWGEGLMGVILTGNIMVDFDSLESGNPRPSVYLSLCIAGTFVMLTY
jgi:2,4-dienoyl-CoA reductase-like NADH-dependent reductase (Old Yellow Enzyme family)